MRNFKSFAVTSKKTRQRGFTLVEMMVALSVSAVLLGVGVPSFKDFTANQSIRTASFTLSTDLMLARSEAIKRNGTVVIAANENDWSKGWQVTTQVDNEQLRDTKAIAHGVVTVGAAPASISFDSSGRVAGVVGIVRVGLRVETGSRVIDRCISLDPSGMTKVVAEACS